MINGLLILLISLFCDEYEGGVYGLLAVRFLLSYPCVTHYVSVLCHLCLCLPHLLCVIVLSLCFILCFLSHVCVWSPSASPFNCPHVPVCPHVCFFLLAPVSSHVS